VLGEPSIRRRSRAMAQWLGQHEPGVTASRLVEKLAG
jgi:hypothetical protein